MGDNMACDPARNDELVLVDGLDRAIGTASKETAHREGLLHRAFSVVLFRDGANGACGRDGGADGACGRDGGTDGACDASANAGADHMSGTSDVEVLLSQRAAGKYHSAGLWANSCCSHPRAGENLVDAAYRRVREELGCQAAGLREVAAFAYRADFGTGIIEHEFDHVLVGRCAGEPAPDPAEVSDVRWISLDALAAELAERPEHFAAWAPMALSLACAGMRR